MTRFNIILFFGLVMAPIISSAQSLVQKSEELKLMGSRFVITITADNNAIANKAITKGINEIRRIESLISSWDPSSQTSLINKKAGVEPVVVDQELFELIKRAKKVSELTDGAFDITIASMLPIYNFDKKEKSLPDNSVINNARKKIDWKKIILNRKENTVFLAEQDMRIGFGAIGKGYAAEKAKQIMNVVKGVKGGIVNAGGDLSIWGMTTTDSESWNIKIANPQDIRQPLAYLDVKNTAVVTSGNYEKYFTSEGNRFSHIINPKTGIPTIGIKSVTIICPGAELGDALATSVFVLGVEDGLYLINQIQGIEAVIITDDNKILTSEHIKLNYY